MDPVRYHLDSIDVTPATLAIVEELLQQTQVATCITVCALTVVAWDWTLSLEEELRVMKRCGRSIAVLVYFLARASSVTGCVLGVVFLIKVSLDENQCSAIFNWIGVMTMIGSSAKAWLFLLRVRAIYGNSKLVIWLSRAGWLTVVFARMSLGFMINTSPLKQIDHCAITDMGSLPIFSIWLNVLYDTSIFLSISVRLASYANLSGTPWIQSFVRGYGLPHTMRHLLRDGQKYYGITILFSLLAAIISASQASPIYRGVSSAPAVAVETVMTCKVFRAMILRSSQPIQNTNMSTISRETRTTAMSLFELDSFMELRIRTTNIEHEQV